MKSPAPSCTKFGWEREDLVDQSLRRERCQGAPEKRFFPSSLGIAEPGGHAPAIEDHGQIGGEDHIRPFGRSVDNCDVRASSLDRFFQLVPGASAA